MNCERAKELFADYLVGQLDEGIKGEIEAHLVNCPSCRIENTGLQEIWTKLSALPTAEPSAGSQARFDAMLEAYVEGMKHTARGPSPRFVLAEWLGNLWPRNVAWQFALAILLFTLGLVIGPRLIQPQKPETTTGRTTDPALAQLRDEVSGLKQMVTISLLQQQSASERLRGVEWGSRLLQPDAQVLSALLRALDSDPNVNVRLAAVDALHQFANEAKVRQGLLQSLADQRSPLVQIELINLMVDLREKDSIPVLKQLADRQDLNPTVRERVEWGLQKLG